MPNSPRPLPGHTGLAADAQSGPGDNEQAVKNSKIRGTGCSILRRTPCQHDFSVEENEGNQHFPSSLSSTLGKRCRRGSLRPSDLLRQPHVPKALLSSLICKQSHCAIRGHCLSHQEKANVPCTSSWRRCTLSPASHFLPSAPPHPCQTPAKVGGKVMVSLFHFCYTIHSSCPCFMANRFLHDTRQIFVSSSFLNLMPISAEN